MTYHAINNGGRAVGVRALFAAAVARTVEARSFGQAVRQEASNLGLARQTDALVMARQADALVLALQTDTLVMAWQPEALVVSSGPLTSDALSHALTAPTVRDAHTFCDAAAPAVTPDHINPSRAFRQSRYDTGADCVIVAVCFVTWGVVVCVPR